MKKSINFFALAALILATVSCAQEWGDDNPSRRSVSHAFIASLDGSGTRTDRDDAGHTVWVANDVIRYFGNVTSPAELSLKTGGSRVVINAELNPADTCITAVYGATSVSEIDFESNSFCLSGVLPYEQDGTFARANVSVAHNDLTVDTLGFKNITSMICFSLSREDVDYVILSTGGGEPLHGDGTVVVQFDGTGRPTTSLGGTTGSSVRVNLDGTGFYYVSVLPQTWSKGFVLKCFNKSGARIGTASYTGKVLIGASRIINLGTLDVDKRIVEDDMVDLSATETANCYIIPELGADYRFLATVKGNSGHPINGNPDRAEILWKTAGTTVAPGAGDVVTGVSLEGNYVHFTAISNGSAIIAVKAGDTILWSWHIWVWEGFDYEANAQVYANNAGILMDRNLGAILAGPGEGSAKHGSSGLLYQWGRKDPFPGRSSATYGVVADGTIPSSEHTGNVEYAVSNPTVFISYTDASIKDWIYGDSRLDNLWAANKTEYDPCPPGWQVPSLSVWTLASGVQGTFYCSLDSVNEGMQVRSKYAPDYNSVWYPATGYRTGADTPYISFAGEHARWWSYNTSGDNIHVMSLRRTNQIQLEATEPRALAANVRCSRQTTPVEGIIINNDPLITLDCYASMNLSATVYPDYAFDKRVVWSSSNPDMVSVNSETGRITAKKASIGTVITVTSLSNPSISASVSVNVNPDSTTDLSEAGYANCYIVSHPGSYKFAARKGVSGELLSNAYGVDVLWETYGTAEYNTYKPVIKLAEEALAGDYVFFSVPVDMKNGNALLAARDNEGKIIWSWHIWACMDFDPNDSAYYRLYNGGKESDPKVMMMDRNLGATTATKNDVTSYGLLYQWGRKDPFLGPRSTNGSERAESSSPAATNPGMVTSDFGHGSIAYATQNPTVFITWNGSSYGWDWMSDPNDNLWSSVKTENDPCPAGWRVPDGGENGVWIRALGNPESGVYDVNFDEANGGGIDFSGVMGQGSIYYPDSGFLHRETGAVQGAGQYFMSWSCTTSGSRAYCFYHGRTEYVSPRADFFRAAAGTIRCMRDTAE